MKRKGTLTTEWVFSGLLTDGGLAKRSPLRKVCHTSPKMMKLGKVVRFVKMIQKIYKSRNTPHKFC